MAKSTRYRKTLQFPTGGLVRRANIQSPTESPYTSFDNLNWRPRDTAMHRERGGTRPGLGPAFYGTLPDRVNMAEEITVIDSTGPSQWSEDFRSGSLGSMWIAPTLAISGIAIDRPSIDQELEYAYGTGSSRKFAYHAPLTNFDKTKTQRYEMFMAPWEGAWAGTYYLWAWLHDTTPFKDTPHTPWSIPDNCIQAAITINGTSGTYNATLFSQFGGVTVASTGNLNVPFTYVQPGWFTLEVGATTARLLFLGTVVCTLTHGIATPPGTTFGFGFLPASATSRCQASEFRVQYSPSSAVARPRTLAVLAAGGNLYCEGTMMRELGDGAEAGQTKVSTSCTLATGRILQAVARENILYIADHEETRFDVEDAVITGIGGNKVCSPTIADFAATVHSADDLLLIYGPDGSSALGQFEILYTFTESVGSPTAAWTNAHLYATSERVRPTAGGAYLYECVVGGTSAAGEPAWGTITEIGGDIVDGGTLTWRRIAKSFLQIYPALPSNVTDVVSIRVERAPKKFMPRPEVTGEIPIFAATTGYRRFMFVRPTTKNGYVYEVTTAGTTATEPTWGTTVGGTTTSGGVTFTCRKMVLTRWMAATDFGSIPLGCDSIMKFLDRICLGGYPAHAFWMPRTSDPYDWLYTEDPLDVGRPMAMTVSEAGSAGEVITALAPHGDDYAIIGCRNSIWMLAGDPTAGGSMVNRERSVGPVSRTAWCHGPGGEFIFLSSSGAKYLPPAGSAAVQDISQTRLPEELMKVDPVYYDVLVAFDPGDMGVHFSLAADAPRPVGNFYFDWLGNSWWRVDYHGLIYPTVMHTYRSEDPYDACVIFGCFDGGVRRHRDEYENDGGTVLSDYVLYGPFRLGESELEDGAVEALYTVLSRYSGPVEWTLRIAPTAEGACNADVFAGTPPLPAGYHLLTGVWSAGENPPVYPQLAGAFMVLAVKAQASTKRWAFIDSIIMEGESLGRRHFT